MLTSYSEIQSGRKATGRQEREMLNRPRVAVVDDDRSVRESLPDLLREFGFDSQAFSSSQEFLDRERGGKFGCLILDIGMPGMSGLELQKELRTRGDEVPIILITGRRDEAIRRRGLDAGAVEFLYKPFSDTSLLDALNLALKLS
jgi:FixJ family two-component response regulator